ncbi:MAG: hypothetical protein VXW65_05275 [Pseudomonadota bacterium]|nr:hypothetical protein [Pseudomonadota bacterium]
MHTLDLCPLQEGYSVQHSCNIIRQPMAGGLARYYADFTLDAHLVSVNWVLTKADYDYLMAFYRVWQRNPNQRFWFRLLIGGHLAYPHESVFVPDSLQLIQVRSAVYTVAAQLEVVGEQGLYPQILSSRPYALDDFESVTSRLIALDVTQRSERVETESDAEPMFSAIAPLDVQFRDGFVGTAHTDGVSASLMPLDVTNTQVLIVVESPEYLSAQLNPIDVVLAQILISTDRSEYLSATLTPIDIVRD